LYPTVQGAGDAIQQAGEAAHREVEAVNIKIFFHFVMKNMMPLPTVEYHVEYIQTVMNISM
jgi:hypothetical protein